jgi:hypothetical protein
MLKYMGGFFILVGIALLIAGIVSLNTEQSYSGKMVLYGQDAIDFKTKIADPKVTVISLQSMSSDPSYVEFSVRVPKYVDFEFGKADELVGQRGFCAAIAGAVVMFMGLMGILMDIDLDKQYPRA